MDELAGVRDASIVAASAPGAEVALERGPGVHVVADAHPHRAGQALAAELGAELADTAMSAEVAIRARLAVTPVRASTTRASSAQAAALAGAYDGGIGQRPELHVTSSVPSPLRTLAAAHVTHLRQLAAAVERTDRVRERAEQATTERIVSARTGLALHPETIRHAAAAVLEARRRVAALEDSDGPLDRASEGSSAELDPSTGSTALEAPRGGGYAPVAIGVLLIGVALAGAFLLSGLPPVLAVVPILLGVLIAGSVRQKAAEAARRRSGPSFMPLPDEPRRPVTIDAPTAGERTGTIVQGVTRPRTRPQSPSPKAIAQQQQDHAERTWASLAGAAADPLEVDEVVRRNDPQAELLRHAATDDPSVRAAMQVTSRARQARDEAWTALGEPVPADATSGPALDEALARLQAKLEAGPPGPPDQPDTIDLRDDVDQTDQGASLSKLRDVLAHRSLEAVLEPGLPTAEAVPLVLVEPFAGLGPGRRGAMKRQLELLADHHEVIVVVGALSTTAPAAVGDDDAAASLS